MKDEVKQCRTRIKDVHLELHREREANRLESQREIKRKEDMNHQIESLQEKIKTLGAELHHERQINIRAVHQLEKSKSPIQKKFKPGDNIEYNTIEGWKPGQILEVNEDGTFEIARVNGSIGHKWRSNNVRPQNQHSDGKIISQSELRRVAIIANEIDALRHRVSLCPRKFNSIERNDIDSRIKERDQLNRIADLCDDIHDLRGQLGWPKKVYKDEDLTGPNAMNFRVKERDNLRSRIARKRQTDPLARQIQRLHKSLGLPKRQFTKDQLTGPIAVKDRILEKEYLEQTIETIGDIHGLRKDLGLSQREFDSTKLLFNIETSNDLLRERTRERNDLKQMVPLVQEIRELCKKLSISRDFKNDELYGGTALSDRRTERDDLLEKVKDSTNSIDEKHADLETNDAPNSTKGILISFPPSGPKWGFTNNKNIIMSVTPGGFAAKKGLKPNAIIREVNGVVMGNDSRAIVKQILHTKNNGQPTLILFG